jgi:acyl-coenzyme A thioesterase PaaI-like protein
MLYDTVGPALLATVEPVQFQSTLEQHVSFLRPVRPGRVTTHGRIIHRVGDTVFLEASRTSADGELAAISTATAQVIQLAEARDAA